MLDALQALGYLKQKKGAYSGIPWKSKRTTIRAGKRLIELIEKHKITFADLRTEQTDEVIILKRPKRAYWDKGEPIEYEDNETTRQLRRDVEEINSWLAKADITFDSSALNQPVDVRAEGFIAISPETSKAAEGSSGAFGKICRNQRAGLVFVSKVKASLNSTTPN